MTKLHGITAAEFDKKYPIGSTFKYFPSINNPEFREVESRSPAWALGHGAVVVSVEGCAGCLAVEHMEAITVGTGPAVVVQDADGFWAHPATPQFEESTPYSECMDWYSKQGLEVKGHYMEGDSDDLTARWDDGDLSAVADWQPSVPEGEGWYLWSIFDTEDGPYCEFARRAAPEGEQS